MEKLDHGVSKWVEMKLDVSRPKALLHVAVWISAGIIGLAAVLYARLVAYCQDAFFGIFHKAPLLMTVAGPALFVLATWFVKKFA